ncbi:hypothetical protein HZH66_003107 [Vespula vulgaris]|uniref:Uncharacterized protein n=1 Tax=Vespula vulgaris TaxID=7454 RepID=A0A834NFV4_VESVU|nr:hypothetical protein HZH66_003107 [Vespula vulgaris]
MGISGAIEANRSEGEQRAVAGAVEVNAVLPEMWKEEAKKVMEETSLDRTLRFVEKVERFLTLKTKIHVYRNSSFDNDGYRKTSLRVEIPLRPPVTIVELEIYLGRVTSPSDWHLLLLLLQHPSHGFPFDIIDTALLDAYD